MNTEPIVFRQGEENGIVIERENFAKSIFVNQYQQACYMFANLWKRLEFLKPDSKVREQPNRGYGIDNLFSNIIAFCGDRGEGKSSCMTSVATILTDKSVRAKAQKDLIIPIDSDGKEILPQPEDIDWLGIIDPSFFDEQHNILELMLGQMYAKASAIKRTDENSDAKDVAYKRRRLMEQFQVVKNSICLLEPKEQVYDTISEMSDLAASIRLKFDITDLFKCYLDFMDKKCILICVDDIDLNVKDAYKMSEMLRKYFVSPYCIVLVAVKVEQLEEVIANYHEKEYKMSEASCKQIAQKYVAKLFPRGNRVPMPAIEDICERIIQIAELYSKENDELKRLTVKERVVQLIFQKTGYVFYNTQFLSPIVPTNLRSLRHLLGALEALPDAKNKNGVDNEIGREVFKNYFWNTWVTATLHATDHAFANQIAIYDDLTTLNAFVVEYFVKRIRKAEIEIKELPTANRDQHKNGRAEIDNEIYSGDYAPLFLQIANSTNTSANISVGDVMYILWLCSTITVNRDIQNLIFFIKTVYSMRLYACYNEITEGKNSTLFPDANNASLRVNIHKADSLYDRVNRVQRLVNGSFFSYPQGALLSGKRDRMVIDFRKAKYLFSKLKEEAKKEEDNRSKDYDQTLKMCEFLALCITFASTKENVESSNFSRYTKTPTFLGTFSHTANYAVFDFLNPFYALTNIKYAYHRFDEILSDTPTNYSDYDEEQQDRLFDLADRCPQSLLSQMKLIRDGWYDDNWDMHGLVSDSIIRVIDIQWAIYEELLRQYRRHRVGSISEKIYHAYNDIQQLQITLFPRVNVSGGKVEYQNNAHIVAFDFISILRLFLGDGKNAEQLDEILTFTESENRLVATDEFMSTLKMELSYVNEWPLHGKEVKRIIKKASSSLDKNQRASFSARLGKLINTNSQYFKPQIDEMMNQIRDIYMLAQTK